MTTKQYQKKMEELGISRAGFEEDSEIAATPCGTQIKTTREPMLINANASTAIKKPPIAPVPGRLHGNASIVKTARKWWDSLSPEEQEEQRRVRSRNAKSQGRRRMRH